MSKPSVKIFYCVRCKWLLRAAWLCQELLQTFETELGEVAIAPGESGQFLVSVDGQTVWDRKVDGGFPQAKELKQRVRDVVAPARDLGHADIGTRKEDREKS